MKYALFAIGLTALGTSACASNRAHTDTPASQGAFLPIAAARASAIAKVPGTVANEELVEEHGESVYSFAIHPSGSGAGASTKKVKVDARTGAVLSVEDEDDDATMEKFKRDDKDD